jgi:hypothetical protein
MLFLLLLHFEVFLFNVALSTRDIILPWSQLKELNIGTSKSVWWIKSRYYSSIERLQHVPRLETWKIVALDRPYRESELPSSAHVALGSSKYPDLTLAQADYLEILLTEPGCHLALGRFSLTWPCDLELHNANLQIRDKDSLLLFQSPAFGWSHLPNPSLSLRSHIRCSVHDR